MRARFVSLGVGVIASLLVIIGLLSSSYDRTSAFAPVAPDDSRQAQNFDFPEQGFALTAPMGWSGRVGNEFGRHLPADTVTLGSASTSYDIAIVSLRLPDGLQPGTQEFALAVLGKYKGVLQPDDFVVGRSSVPISGAVRITLREPLLDDMAPVTVMSDFAVVGGTGYWLSTAFYAVAGSPSQPASAQELERVSMYETVAGSFAPQTPAGGPQTTLLPDELRPTAIEAAGAQALEPDALFVWPTTGYVGWLFDNDGLSTHADHNGVDIWTTTACNSSSTSPGNPVFAASTGNLDWKYQIPGGAYDGVRINYGTVNGVPTWTHYWHLGSLNTSTAPPTQTSFVTVSTGAVGPDTLVGYQGNLMRDGNGGAVQTTCVHLHLTVANGSADRNAVDPSPYFGVGLNWNGPSRLAWMTFVQHDSTSMQVCRESNFGNCTSFIADVPRFGDTPVGNDVARSIRSSPSGEYAAVLYEHIDFEGVQVTTEGQIADLGSTPVGYGASSMRVRRHTNPAFTLYDSISWGGAAWRSDRTIPSLSDWGWNDNGQSVKVSPGYELFICSDPGFRGVCGKTMTDVSNLDVLANGLLGAVSSVYVCPDKCPLPPSPPALATPVGGDVFAEGETVTLSWNDSGVQYQAEVSGGELTSTRTRDWDSSNLWSISDLPASSHPYYWRVRVRNDAGASGNLGEGPWSESRSFWVEVVTNLPPELPGNPSPDDGATNASVAPVLTWSGGDPDAGDTVAYRLFLSASSNPTDLAYEGVNASYAGAGLAQSTDYYWKVVVTDNHGATTVGDVWHFATGAQQVRVDSVSTMDREWQTKTAFAPGEAITLVIEATNATGAAQDSLWDWTVHGPDGQVVPELSIEKWSYRMEVASNSFYVAPTIPLDAVAGQYTFTGQLTIGGASDSKQVQFTVGGRVFVPLVLR